MQNYIVLFEIQSSLYIRKGITREKIKCLFNWSLNVLILRQWQISDYTTFSNITADPAVMKYFPNVLSVDESNQLALKITSFITEKGWGFWAVELKDTGRVYWFCRFASPNR